MLKNFTVGTMYWLNPKYGADDFARDCRAMAENGYTLIRLILWWELIEERKGRYDFSFVDRFMAAAEKEGLQVMMTIGFYPPFWLTCELDEAGKLDPGRYPSLQRPEVCIPLAAFIREMVTRYKDSPAMASWNIWNEPTLNTTRSRPVLEAFLGWLKQRYPNYEALEASWRGEYPVLSLIMPESMEDLTVEFLDKVFRLGTRGRASAIEYDFQRFAPELLCREVRWLCTEIRKYDTTHPTHANFHAVNKNPVLSGRDFYRTARELDSVSSSMHQSNDNDCKLGLRDRRNFYMCGTDRAWSWLKGGNAMVGELQVGTSDVHVRKYTPTPETIIAELFLAYAAGLHGVIHWEFQAWRCGTFEPGEFGLRAPADGGETPRSRAVERFARYFYENRDRLFPAERPRAKIAILDSFSNGIYEYVQSQDHANVPWMGWNYHNAILGCYRALREANFAVEFLCEEEVAAGKLQEYSVLYLPGTPLIGKDIAEQIMAFVRQGGNLWADARCGWMDDHMYVRSAIPGNGLQQVFGIREHEYRAEQSDVTALTVSGKVLTGQRMRQDFELLPGSGAAVYARYRDGGIAAVENTVSGGKVRLWGLELARRLRDHLEPEVENEIAGFAAACGILPEIELPAGVIGRVLNAPSGRIAVLSSLLENPVEITLPEAWQGACVIGSDKPLTCLELRPEETAVLFRS